jgi:hypothetical protein
MEDILAGLPHCAPQLKIIDTPSLEDLQHHIWASKRQQIIQLPSDQI